MLPNPIVPGIYRDNGGHIVYIYKVDRDNEDYPILGTVIDEDGGETIESYTPEGRYTTNDSEAQWDLAYIEQEIVFKDYVEPIEIILETSDQEIDI